MRPETWFVGAFGFAVGLTAMTGLLWQARRGAAAAWAARTMRLAVAGSAVWSAAGLAVLLLPAPGLWLLLRWADLLRAAAWIAFMLVLLHGLGAAGRDGDRRRRWVRAGMMAAVLVAVVAAAFETWSALDPALGGGGAKAGLIASLVLAIAGLTCVEQLLRNAPERQRWGVWPLAIGLGAIHVYDLYLYSDAVLLGQVDVAVWSVQGAVTACAAPLLWVATTRNDRWTRPLAVSHNVVFHSTLLLASGAYLLVVAALGYLVQFFGGAWGPALQLVLFVAAMMVMAILLTLGTLRSKLRVLIGKHFFKRRYDYREQWLRFSRLLAAGSAADDLHVRCIQALADLVESPAGSLWLRRGDAFRPVAHWNAPSVAAVEFPDGALASFLARTNWVVDVAECRQRPDVYGGLRLPEWLLAVPNVGLVVPLAAADRAVGFVVLMTPRVQIDVDWEVLDLLKTAGSEVAALLLQVEASQALAEAEKFAAVSRMSAFVVHDLKNLVAQLSLMLRNAERHGNNPEFRRDMRDTVQHVVDRMNSMLAQARLGTRPVQDPQAVDVAAVLRSVYRSKQTQHAGLSCAAMPATFAIGHADRLEHVFAHIVQNAIDATPPEGHIRLGLNAGSAGVVVEVDDDGAGMSDEFLQSRLFRPFQTTKGAGLGIGVYESQEYLAGLGGRLLIESAQGRGTRVRIVLPPAHTVTQPPAAAIHAA